MKTKLFYVFLGLAAINLLVNGLVTFINLVLGGILMTILASKEKSGEYSMWKIMLGIGIAGCSALIGIARILQFVKL